MRMRAAVVQAFRRAAVPLISYYVVTLVLPLANGAAHAGAAFVEHALVVLVVPPILIVLAGAACAIARGRRALPIHFVMGR
jgi:uncharacterized membrane-anchored protein